MSFDGIKGQLVKRLGSLGYSESQQAFDFENASSNEYGNRYIIIPISGSLEEGDGGTQQINSQFDDVQTWQIQIAFGRSAHNDVLNRDEMSRKVTDIIKDLDNPTNWENITNGAKLQEYESWEVSETSNYFLVTIILRIIDTVTY